MSVFGASTGTGTNPLAKLGLLKDKTVVEDEFEAGFSFEGLTPPDAPENTDPVVEKATENTPAETPVEDGFDLYIKCLPVGEPHSMIEAYLGEVLENATSVLGSDYRLVDYGKGYEQVQVFMERDIKGLSGAIVVMDPFSAVSKAVLPVLRRYARRVIAGL